MSAPRAFAPELRRNRLAGAISLAVHVLGAVALVQVFRHSLAPEAEPTRLIVLEPPGTPSEHPMPYRTAEAPPAEVTPPPFEVEARVIPPASGPLPVAGGAGRLPRDAAPGAPEGRLELAPRYVSGQLWVPPLPLTREDLIRRPDRLAALAGMLGRSGGGGGAGAEGEPDAGQALHARRLDSAVTAIVQAYLDSAASDPGTDVPELPRWVADIGGLDVGIDQQWIYFGGLRIPSVILALFLPGEGGNYLADKRADWLMDARREIYYAAWMADTQDEFRENVRKLRERVERERAFARNQEGPVLLPDSATSEGGQ